MPAKRQTAAGWLPAILFICLLPLAAPSTTFSQQGKLETFVPTAAQLRGAGGGRERGGRVYKARIEPHWLEGDASFWYRNELPGGRTEFVFVDCREGVRKAAFDHERLAKALREAGVERASGDRLPIESIQFDQTEGALLFRGGGKSWRLGLESYELAEVEGGEDVPLRSGLRPRIEDAPRRSARTGAETELNFINRSGRDVELFWLDDQGERQSYGAIASGGMRLQHTFGGHVWEVRGGDGRTLSIFEAPDFSADAEITGRPGDAPRRGGPTRTNPRERRGPRDSSPDGKWTAVVREGNLFLRSRQDGEEFQLSRDGDEETSYGMLEWSPDSTSLVAFRIEPGDEKEVHLVESSPAEGGRAVLHTRRYPLPGDKFTSYELRLFDVAERGETACDVESIDFGRPRLRWSGDGHTFTYEKTDRGHQRFRLIEVDAASGATRSLIDERTDTFIWSAHTENLGIDTVTWLENSGEMVYVSERDGWRHLYLIDAQAGEIEHQITTGDWVVRGVDRIDEEQRQVWFHAGGVYPDQDPYFIHYGRVNFDGSGLVMLTEGNGTHSIAYSPRREYLIDTYSRVDMPPVHELRRVGDGSLVCRLEEADVSELADRGWEPPEVFVAKGRDGETGIWGIICRPPDFDPEKSYPVIEQIYAGPQGSYVPKSFSSSRRFASLTDLGFIVVQIDGMGTANRSKAFHDVCWHNLKDAGLPDRVLWHRAAAERHPQYDIERVGIYGTSAGGQNATAAMLWQGDLYKAAVSACGCHDNRMDKASWNEQWMGYPVGPQYAASSNIDNAHRLSGNLLLIVGEMDTNVPPESTLRLADALIKAGKDFDLLVVPGAGHGMGGAYGQRRMQDFFIRHLHGVEPPNRNASAGRR